jgi:hypothetical protein
MVLAIVHCQRLCPATQQITLFGHRIRMGPEPGPWMVIVGIAEEARYYEALALMTW